jgi:ubiquinone/menaquinone biosynthesis C-methylase UbiE
VFKTELIHKANIQPGQRVLDLGCGTATLTIMIKQLHPLSIVVGLDGDHAVLGIGNEKAAKAGLDIPMNQGIAFDLPYPDGTFDKVLSSLVFHHLTTENKERALREVLRVLRSGGEFFLADFGPPRSTWARIISPVMAKLEEVGDNHKGLLPVLFSEAGFEQVEEASHFPTIFGTLSCYSATKVET